MIEPLKKMKSITQLVCFFSLQVFSEQKVITCILIANKRSTQRLKQGLSNETNTTKLSIRASVVSSYLVSCVVSLLVQFKHFTLLNVKSLAELYQCNRYFWPVFCSLPQNYFLISLVSLRFLPSTLSDWDIFSDIFTENNFINIQ